MGKDFKGLVNKLEGVDVGSLLLLQREDGEMVAGFVKQLTSGIVKLSPEPPTNSYVHETRLLPTRSRDRTYRLSYYNQYKVLDANFTSE